MITVITPYKDAELWLGRCLESLSKQRGDFQFITVDDNSTDNSYQIAQSYEQTDHRFLSLKNEHKAGVSGARNTGLDHAEGEWFTFLDADDEYDIDAWRNYKRSLGITADIHQFNHMRYYPKVDRMRMKYANPEGWYDVEHLPVFWCMVWNKLYRTETFGKVRFVEGLQYGEDEIFNLECFDISDSIYSAKEIGIIHHFDNKLSLSKVKKSKGLLDHTHGLEDLLFRLEKDKTRKAVLDTLSEHWSSKTYNKIFVEEKPSI